MNISIIGAGYIGLPMAAVFADQGHHVWVIRRNKEKIEKLKRGISPIFEPGLEELIKKGVASGKFVPTTEYSEAVPYSDIVFICVGTPMSESGAADLSQVYTAAKEMAKHLKSYTVVVNKCTAPVGAAKEAERTIKESLTDPEATFDVVSCPEFLREGSAVKDFLKPDRIVIGSNSQKATDLLLEAHKLLPGERLIVDPQSAEIIKHASNSMLATHISFINSLAKLCENTGADINKVAQGMRLDKRIGPHAFLNAGLGYAGGCFPKDVQALIHIAKQHGCNMGILEKVEEINQEQRKDAVKKAFKLLPDMQDKTIAVAGLAFKPHTDDMREAPSIDIIKAVQGQGARVRAFDPAAREEAKKVLDDIEYFDDVYKMADGADLLIFCTEWPEFKNLDLEKIKSLMKTPNILDGRNIFEPEDVRGRGFNYLSIGRM